MAEICAYRFVLHCLFEPRRGGRTQWFLLRIGMRPVI